MNNGQSHPSATQDATAVDRAAHNALLQVVARASMVVVAVVGVPMGGWVASRMIGAVDKIIERQDLAKDELTKVNMAIVNMQGDNKLLNGRIDEANRTNTSRLDALSAWTRKNSDEIDKIKDWFLKPPTNK